MGGFKWTREANPNHIQVQPYIEQNLSAFKINIPADHALEDFDISFKGAQPFAQSPPLRVTLHEQLVVRHLAQRS